MGAAKANLSEASVILICMDEISKHDRSGRLYVRSREEPYVFQGMLELLRKMEEFYDLLDYPQASMSSRSLNPSSGKKESKKPDSFRKARKREQTVVLKEEDMKKNRGREATFLVRVRYRQSASWQGHVTWMEQDKMMTFHSTLELVKIMDSALGDGGI